MDMAVPSATLATTASATRTPRRRGAGLDEWVTCVSPYLGSRRRMWVRPAAREYGHASWRHAGSPQCLEARSVGVARGIESESAHGWASAAVLGPTEFA